MRIVGFTCWLLICALTLAAQAVQDEPYFIPAVRVALEAASSQPQVFTGSMEKQLRRAGDAVSVALLKVLDDSDLSNPARVESFLPIIKVAFSCPECVSNQVDKKPRVTLFLLLHLEAEASDPKVRSEIQDTVKFIRNQTGP